MKKTILLLALLSVGVSQAQFKVKINDKPLVENTVVKVEDIKSFDIAFDKPKKISYIGLGRVILGVVLLDKDNKTLEEFIIKKDGTNAVEAFLQDLNVYYNVIPDANGESAFKPTVLMSSFLKFLPRIEDETVKIEINLVFFDKVGYNKYGDQIPLVKKFVFTIDNKTNAMAFAQQQQEKKAKEAAEQAERDKANEEARKAEEIKKTKSKAGGLLKGLIGK